jgi:8-oxo-dGTP diphosphatase
MNPSDRAVALIIRQRHILLIHRVRASEEYYVFPGGHLEEGETAAAACIREVFEETGLQVSWIEPAFQYTNPDRGRLGTYFFVDTLPGVPYLNGPELDKRSEDNRYILEWVPLDKVAGIPLRPVRVRAALAAVQAESGPFQQASQLAACAARFRQLLEQD